MEKIINFQYNDKGEQICTLSNSECPRAVTMTVTECNECLLSEFEGITINISSKQPPKINYKESCSKCGQVLTEIRGRYPKDPKRKVCACCATEKLEKLEQLEDNKCNSKSIKEKITEIPKRE